MSSRRASGLLLAPVLLLGSLSGCGDNGPAAEVLDAQADSLARTCLSFAERRGFPEPKIGADPQDYLDRRYELSRRWRRPTWIGLFKDTCDLDAETP